ncbi:MULTISPECIES: TonB-dependent receptor [unclassified Sphingomonas]|uniref:TonB-dependent receptor n=1 Tax=unclassified Sphingomonas TaxID=196159 RepID=UPI00092B107D|nr:MULTISPECIES: TonB-dependent receptor [unclassified Sphingomonas]OJU17131.1 MAG: TonB-dependent receptor [Sphingomonas sp. 66-10]
MRIKADFRGASLIALAYLSFAPAARAQQAPAPAGQPAAETPAATGDIVVTAQFRSQRLQDTPLAITALSGDAMEAKGQTNISEVAAQTPNVTLAPQNGYLGPGIIAFIRGVGQSDPNFALESGVGMYIDDVYLPTLTGSLLDLMDLDRVEILRGPQGTLAGRNSLGGSIKLYSVKPQGDGSGALEATYGSYNRIDARGHIDLKLADNLFLRVSAATKNRDGYVKRLDYAQTHPGSNVPTQASDAKPELGTLGGQSFVATKAALRWLPTSNVEINVSGDYTRQRDEAGASVLLFANKAGVFTGPSATGGPRPWLAGVNGSPVALNCAFVAFGANSCDTPPAGYDRRFINYGTYADNATRDGQMAYKPLSLTPHSNLDNYGFAGTIDWTISDGLALKSITAYRHYEADWSFAEGAPLQSSMYEQQQSNTQWSQELRLTGKALGNRLDYTVGGFYFDTKGKFTGRIDLNYAGIDFLHGPDPTPATNKALFANASFKPVDALTLTGGIRSSWDTKDYGYVRHNPDGTAIQGPCQFFLGAATAGPTGVGNSPNCLLFGLNGLQAHFKSQRTDWRVAADYRVSPELMLYAQVSTGYRAGGINPRPFYPSQVRPFSPETITAYEAGFKSDLFGRMLRFNASAFYNDYKNIILTVFNCPTAAGTEGTPCLQPTNVGSAHVKGVEVETLLRPTSNLSFDGSVSYLDFKYTSLGSANTGVRLDMVPPFTPKWKWNAGAQYEVPDVLGGALSFRVDGSYQSHIYVDAVNTDAAIVSTTTAGAGGGPLPTLIATSRIDGYFLANARVTWRSASDGWSAAFEVRNLTDKYYFTSMNTNFSSVGVISGAPGLPRTWAITIKKEF